MDFSILDMKVECFMVRLSRLDAKREEEEVSADAVVGVERGRVAG